MTDVVVELPVSVGEESQLFGAYLNRFMEQRATEATLMAETADAPFLMVRSAPAMDAELKVLIFQEHGAANDFSSGWARARQGLNARPS